MMRMTYRSADGVEHIEDLVGPGGWDAGHYRRAIARQRPGITITGMEPIDRLVEPAPSDHPALWWITLKVPGRQLTTVLQRGGWGEARRLALMNAETTATIVRMVPCTRKTL